MRQVRIVTDSTADLSPAVCKELGITVVPLTVFFGEVAYRDQIDLDTDQFLRLLAKSGDLPKTSQPSPALFEETYRHLAADGSEIISLHLSARLSGTVRAAGIARDALRGQAIVEVIDARSASLGLGLIVIAAARLAQQGAELHEIASFVRRLSANVHILFFLDTLEYLEKGGRIGRANALLGALLNIRPILKLEDGEVHPVEKVRTRTKAVDRLVEFVELFPNIDELAVIYSHESADLETLLRRIEPTYPRQRIIIGKYGPVIGTHAGPNALGVVVSQGIIG